MDARSLKKQWEDANVKGGKANPPRASRKKVVGGRASSPRRVPASDLPRATPEVVPHPHHASDDAEPIGRGRGKELGHSGSPTRRADRGKEKVGSIPVPSFTQIPDDHSLKKRKGEASAGVRLQGLYAYNSDLPPPSTYFWNVEDLRVASSRCKGLVDPLDLERGRSRSVQSLFDAQFTSLLQSVGVAKMLQERVDECRVEHVVMSKENSALKAAVKQLEAEKDVLLEEKAKLSKDVAKSNDRYEQECRTGAQFLQTDDWKAYRAQLERRAVEAFKESSAFEEALNTRAVAFYGEIVAQCQETLRESGQVDDAIVHLLDPPGGGGADDGDDGGDDGYAPDDEEMVDYGGHPPADA